MPLEPARLLKACRFELTLMGTAILSRGCLVSKCALLIGIGYLFGPWDIIPNRIPVYGYMDQVSFLILGLLAARLFIPIDLDPPIAARCRFGGYRGRGGRPARFDRLRYDLQSHALTEYLQARRRLARMIGKRHAGIVQFVDQCREAARQRAIGRALFKLLGYRLWWSLRAPFARPRTQGEALIVIGGAARSGTTLLRTMLGRHPMIASLPETTIFLRRVSSPGAIGERLGWPPADIEEWQYQARSQACFIERFLGEVQTRSGKPLWAAKTPANIGRFGYVRRSFPRARLVHIVRDGRDVVCSLRRKPFAKLDDAAWDSTAAARRCAVQWRHAVKAGLRFRGNPAYYELRYEDLVRDPRGTLAGLLAFIGVPWDDRVLQAQPDAPRDPYEARAAEEIFDSSIGRWRRDMPQTDQSALLLLIGPSLVELGYEQELNWNGPRAAPPT